MSCFTPFLFLTVHVSNAKHGSDDKAPQIHCRICAMKPKQLPRPGDPSFNHIYLSTLEIGQTWCRRERGAPGKQSFEQGARSTDLGLPVHAWSLGLGQGCGAWWQSWNPQAEIAGAGSAARSVWCLPLFLGSWTAVLGLGGWFSHVLAVVRWGSNGWASPRVPAFSVAFSWPRQLPPWKRQQVPLVAPGKPDA